MTLSRMSRRFCALRKRGSAMLTASTRIAMHADQAQLAGADDRVDPGACAARRGGRRRGRRGGLRGHAHAATCAPVAARTTDSSSASVARELTGDPALVHHEHAVGHPEHLGQLGADHQHREALARELGHQPVHLGLRADVDAARRLVDDQDLRARGEPLAEHDLLLVAAGQEADRVGELVELQLQLGRPVRGELGLGAGADHAELVAQRLQAGEADVALDAELHHQALLAAVLGDEADAGLHRRASASPA